MWQNQVFPYLKSWDIYSCPSDIATGAGAGTSAPVRFHHISYGYNYGYLSKLEVEIPDPSPACGGTQWFSSVALASVNRASQIIMVGDGAGKHLNAAAGLNLLGSAFNPPDADSSELYFYGGTKVGWAKGNPTAFAEGQSATPGMGQWGDSDGNAFRHLETANYVFVDGHAKSMSKARAGSGTDGDFNNTASDRGGNQQGTGGGIIRDYSQYMWDPRYDSGQTRHY